MGTLRVLLGVRGASAVSQGSSLDSAVNTRPIRGKRRFSQRLNGGTAEAQREIARGSANSTTTIRKMISAATTFGVKADTSKARSP